MRTTPQTDAGDVPPSAAHIRDGSSSFPCRIHRFAMLGLMLLMVAARASAQMRDTIPSETAPSILLDRRVRTFLLTDLLEFQGGGSQGPIRFDAVGWIGGDFNRLWLRLDGEQPTRGLGGEVQADLVYGRVVSPFWSAVAGVQFDTRVWARQRVTRGQLAVGFEGLAPYWLEMEPMLYVSQHGDISARLTTSFDLLFTQRLILQPRIEMNAALQHVRQFGIGSGLNDFELGARLRYEIRREVAPYIGVSWLRRTAGSASLARRAGESVSDAALVAGARLWY